MLLETEHKTHTKVIYTAHGFHFYKGAPLLNWLIYYPIEKYLSRYTDYVDKTRFGFGMEAGYAWFLSKSVTLEPAVYWDINKDRSDFGLQLGFGIYL